MRGRMPVKSRGRKRTVSKKQLKLPFGAPIEAELLAKKLRLFEPAVWQACLTRSGPVVRRVASAVEKLKLQGAKISDLSLQESVALITLGEILAKGGARLYLADRRGPRGPDIDLYHRKLTEFRGLGIEHCHGKLRELLRKPQK